MKLVCDKTSLSIPEKEALMQFLKARGWRDTDMIIRKGGILGEYLFLDTSQKCITHSSADYAAKVMRDSPQQYTRAAIKFDTTVVCVSLDHSIPKEVTVGGYTYVLKQ